MIELSAYHEAGPGSEVAAQSTIGLKFVEAKSLAANFDSVALGQLSTASQLNFTIHFNFAILDQPLRLAAGFRDGAQL